MKILKLKSIVFSLMAIVMVTMFLTSCEKEDVKESSNTISKSTTEKIEDTPESETINFVENLSTDKIEELKYLTSENSIEFRDNEIYCESYTIWKWGCGESTGKAYIYYKLMCSGEERYIGVMTDYSCSDLQIP